MEDKAKKDIYKIACCGVSKNRSIAQAKFIAFELRNAGIENVEILPIVYKEAKHEGMKPDNIIHDSFYPQQERLEPNGK